MRGMGTEELNLNKWNDRDGLISKKMRMVER